MDAEIRSALRAMSEPGVLETLPAQAIRNVAVEFLKREEARDVAEDVVKNLLGSLLKGSPAFPQGDQIAISKIFAQFDEASLGWLASACWDERYRKGQRRRQDEEAAERARVAAAEVKGPSISVPPKMDLTPLERQMRWLQEGTFIKTSTPATSEVNRIRTLARKHGLSVRIRGNELFIVKGTHDITRRVSEVEARLRRCTSMGFTILFRRRGVGEVRARGLDALDPGGARWGRSFFEGASQGHEPEA